MLCTSCAKLKNLCQICVLDLDLKVGVHTRDKALDLTDPIAKAKINREYFVQNAEKNVPIASTSIICGCLCVNA